MRQSRREHELDQYFGYSKQRWEKGKAEATVILRRVAATRDYMLYGDLSDELRTVTIAPHSIAMSAMLGEISTDEHEQGRAMLSAVVVHEKPNIEPGKGFYTCAATLGKVFKDGDRITFWVSELKKVHAEHKSN